MSASSKKKLRKELAAEMMTEKQRQAKKEAKKLKAMTISFVALMVAIALLFTGILVNNGIEKSGYFYKKTIAATINGQKLNSVQMNYYLTDYIQSMYSQLESQYGSSSYANMMLGFSGVDANKALDEQIYDQQTGETWADYYLSQALAKAKSEYTLYAKAIAEGFTLTEEQQATMDSNLSMMELYAQLYGYKNADKWLQARYGYGSSLKSYTEYTRISTIASAYYTKYNESLTYDDAAIRAYEEGKEINFTSFSYASYTVYVSEYLEGGTKDEESGTTTYSDAEKEAARKKAEDVANSLKTATNLEEFDKLIGALEINAEEETAVTSTLNTDKLYTAISSSEEPTDLQKWLSDSARVENEITVITNESTSTDSEGKEVKTVNSYNVVLFQSRNENLNKLANVRHLLVAFEGGTTQSDGSTTYSQEEKDAAKAEAEALLKQWEEGEKTEDSFIALVKEKTDDSGSKETGGLYEDIHPQSSYVENFLNWCISTERQVGDTGIVQTEYGYHIMYFSSFDELTYRDYMIREEMRSNDTEAWYNAAMEGSTATIGKTKYLNMDIILANLASS